MLDNGLLKYFKDKTNKQGFLNEKDLKLEEVQSDILNTVIKCHTQKDGDFYKKFFNYFPKHKADAEILLGQLYGKLGLTSAIYLPVKDNQNGNTFLLSNDIKTFDTKSSIDIESQIKEEEPYGFYGARFVPENRDIVEKYFTPQGISQKLLMRSLDVVTFNTDRAECNYMYKMDDNGKVDGIVTFDNEISGQQASSFLYSKSYKDRRPYFNDFRLSFVERDEFVGEYKENSIANKYLNPSELAEKLGSANVEGIAGDIYAQTGYMVDSDYVSNIAKSMDSFAEDLTK